MQCKYCGATLPDVDFPMVYKELREENGRLEFEHEEAVNNHNKVVNLNSELKSALSSW